MRSTSYSKLGLVVVSREIKLGKISNLTLECIEIADMAVVGFACLTNLGQAQLVVAVVKAQAIVVQDQLLLLVRLMGESIRDNAT